MSSKGLSDKQLEQLRLRQRGLLSKYVPSVESGPYCENVKRAVIGVLNAAESLQEGQLRCTGMALEAAASSWQEGSAVRRRREQPHLKPLLQALDPDQDANLAVAYLWDIVEPYNEAAGAMLDVMFDPTNISGLTKHPFEALPPLPELRPASPLVTFMYPDWLDPEGRPQLIDPNDTGSPTVVKIDCPPEFQKVMRHFSAVDAGLDKVRRITTDRRLLQSEDGGPGFRNDIPWPHSKIEEAVARLHQIWQETTNIKGSGLDGVQLVFADIRDIRRNKETGFDFYAEFIRSLLEIGIPREQIADILDTPPVQRQSLFDSGEVRIVMSTSEALTGLNIQRRLVASHNLDVPDHPGKLARRTGCIVRPGNQLFGRKLIPGIMIHNYVMGNPDEWMWKVVLEKQALFKSVLTGRPDLR